jgi:hypothetical protein
LHRSHRRGLWEHLASLGGKYPYRCRECGYRGLLSENAAQKEIDSQIPKDREITATRGAVEWKRRRREILIYAGGFLLFMIFLYFITREHGEVPGGN